MDFFCLIQNTKSSERQCLHKKILEKEGKELEKEKVQAQKAFAWQQKIRELEEHLQILEKQKEESAMLDRLEKEREVLKKKADREITESKKQGIAFDT